MDDRTKSRVVFHVNASIDYDGRTINGEVENLSINGMFMKTAEDIQLDKDVEVSIYLSGTTSELSIKINGIIVRREERGIAIKFTQIGFDSYIHLKSIIDFNKMDENKIIREFEETFSPE
jgi:phage baseplate assembly protein gpV